MTEWDAVEYARISGLQAAMAEEVLALLDLKGSERVLDIGCGDGKITAEIAARIPRGSVLGVDASRDMISFAASHFGPLVQMERLFSRVPRSLPASDAAPVRRSGSEKWLPSIGYLHRSKGLGL